MIGTTWRRAAGLGGALLAARRGAVPSPVKLTWALTWRCHHRCSACAIWRRGDHDELSACEVDRALATLPGLRWLDLTGGEAFLHPEWPDIARSVLQRLPRLALVHFPTAGFHPERAEAAAKSLVAPDGPRVVVSVSIDGPPEVHDRLRGIDGAFARACETLARLRRAGIECYAGFTLQPGNLTAIDATVAALDRVLPRGFRHADLHVNAMHRSPHYFGNTGAEVPAAAEVATAVRAFVQRKGVPADPIGAIEWLWLSLLPLHLRSGRSPVACRSADLSAYVAPDGTVYACTIDPRGIGALRDVSCDFMRLWTSQARLELRREVAADRCVGCWTPCEAYQTLLSSPATDLVRAVRSARRA